MEVLDNKWIFSKQLNEISFCFFEEHFLFREKQCPDPSSSPATLGLHNMLGRISINSIKL